MFAQFDFLRIQVVVRHSKMRLVAVARYDEQRSVSAVAVGCVFFLIGRGGSDTRVSYYRVVCSRNVSETSQFGTREFMAEIA